MLTWSEISRYLRLLLRWWTVLLIAVALAGGSALLISRWQPKFYATSASLMIGDNFQATAPNQLSFDLSNTLASFYGELSRREVILQPVADKLQLPFSWQVIADRMLSTNVNRQANLLEISVVDTSPERAAAIANGIAAQLIAYSPTSPEKFEAQRQAVETQITQTDANLKDIDKKINELKDRQTKLDAAVDLRDIQDQLDQLQKSRDSNQSSYNQLLLLRNNSSMNSVSIFEQAGVPGAPMASRTIVAVGMAGVGGLLLAVLAILLLDRLDERWRTGRDLHERTGVVDLGSIPSGPPLLANEGGGNTHRERAVRDAHARIIMAANGQGAHTLLVSSPQPSESRSIFSIDLAHLFARSGHRVLIVDADLSMPRVTQILRGNSVSVEQEIASAPTTSLLAPPQLAASAANIELWSRMQPTPMPNVMLLPGRPHDSHELPLLVPSLRWPELVARLRESADVIIFDGPSSLSSADAALLAPLVDGVVLALDPARDTRSAIIESKDRLLKQHGANLLGAVRVSEQVHGGQKQSAQATATKEKAPGFTISIQLGGKKKGAAPQPPKRSRPFDADSPPTVATSEPVRPATASKGKTFFATGSERVTIDQPGREERLPPTPIIIKPPLSQVIVPSEPAQVIVPPAPPSLIITPLPVEIYDAGEEEQELEREVGGTTIDHKAPPERRKRRPVTRGGRNGRRGGERFGGTPYGGDGD